MLVIFHSLTCLLLAVVAIMAQLDHENAPSFLLPLVILATLSGIAFTLPFFTELFVANYSGAIYEADYNGTPLTPRFWIRIAFSSLLSLLPAIALIPAIRQHPLAVAALALLALLPAIVHFHSLRIR